MKKEYVRPMIIGEEFSADEYVSACWGVACNTSAANKIEDDLNNNPIYGHQSQYCGQYTHQVIANNVPVKMIEVDTYWGDLECTLYTDDTYSEEKDISTVTGDSTIYWVTEGLGNNIYHHVGTTQFTDANRTNHS